MWGWWADPSVAPFMCARDTLHMRVTAKELNATNCMDRTESCRHETDPIKAVPPRHVSIESLFSFAQPDAQHSAGNDPLSQGALGVSSRHRSSGPTSPEAAPAWFPRVGPARTSESCPLVVVGFFSLKVSHHHRELMHSFPLDFLKPCFSCCVEVSSFFLLLKGRRTSIGRPCSIEPWGPHVSRSFVAFDSVTVRRVSTD